MTKHPWLIAAICMFGTALASAHAQPPAAPSRAEQREQMVQRALDAQTPLKAGVAYKELFQKFGDELDQLAMDSRPSVALNAAWERALRLAAKKQVDPQRFLGFFEGVMRAKVPDRWEVFAVKQLGGKDKELYETYLQKHGESECVKRLSGQFYAPMPPKEHETGLGHAPANVSFRFDQDRLEIVIHQKTAVVSAKLTRAIQDTVSKDKGRRLFTAQIDDHFVAIGTYNSTGPGGELHLFDRINGELKWTVNLWGLIAPELEQPMNGGNIWQDMSITISNGRTTVFGALSMGCYAESYENKNGACVFRFSSSLWGSRE